MNAKMAKLVHDYVLDAVQRCFDKIEIEQNMSRLCAATPAGYPPKPGDPLVSITYCNSLLALPRPGQLLNVCSHILKEIRELPSEKSRSGCRSL